MGGWVSGTVIHWFQEELEGGSREGGDFASPPGTRNFILLLYVYVCFIVNSLLSLKGSVKGNNLGVTFEIMNVVIRELVL